MPSSAFGANDRIVLGGIGVGNQGSGNVRSLSRSCDIAAIADSLRVGISGASSLPLEIIKGIEAVTPIDEIRDKINDWLGGEGAGKTPPYIQLLRDIQAGNFLAAPPRPGRPPRQ